MPLLPHRRAAEVGRALAAVVLAAATLCTIAACDAQTQLDSAAPAAASTRAAEAAAEHEKDPLPAPAKSVRRKAESAYLSGAKKLDADDLDAAETYFQRALKLDPANSDYAIAISVTRQHRLAELVRRASQARHAGDRSQAETLLAEARAIDPLDPLVLEHSAAPMGGQASAPQAGSAVNPSINAIADRSRLLSGTEEVPAWKINAPVLAGAIHITPSHALNDFSLRGASADVLRSVASAYGIRAIVDDSVEPKDVRFDLQGVTYEQAMNTLMSMTQSFAVTVDETSILVAKDDSVHRQQLERQLEETIDVPGSTPEQLNELANVIRNVFEVKQVTVQTAQGSLVLRAPEDTLIPLNQVVAGLLESSGEVMVEVKVYEINTTHNTNIGAALPSQFTAFNVNQAATEIVNANQTLVQQAIAQGLISSTASNLDIALGLIGLGLVKSTLASNLIGVFGGGLIQTGISASTNTTLNFGLNSSDTRALDDVQIRVGDRQQAVFREGTRYPIVTSTYSTGLSAAASALGNATIGGVPVASLLSQFAGGSSATIPMVAYEDLGITLNATPVIQRSGRVNLLLDMKIQALGGAAANGMPILLSRRFASDLTLLDGESAVMVSSVSKTEVSALTGIPGISELPGFRAPTQRNAERDSSQLVVIVTPHVVRRHSEQVAGPRIALRNSSSK